MLFCGLLRHSCLHVRAVQYGWSGCVWLYAVGAGLEADVQRPVPGFGCARLSPRALISARDSLAWASRIASATSSAERHVRIMASLANTARESLSALQPGWWRSRRAMHDACELVRLPNFPKKTPGPAVSIRGRPAEAQCFAAFHAHLEQLHDRSHKKVCPQAAAAGSSSDHQPRRPGKIRECLCGGV